MLSTTRALSTPDADYTIGLMILTALSGLMILPFVLLISTGTLDTLILAFLAYATLNTVICATAALSRWGHMRYWRLATGVANTALVLWFPFGWIALAYWWFSARPRERRTLC